jgi:hypothetical protein
MKLMIGRLPKDFLEHTPSLGPHKTTLFSLLAVGVCVKLDGFLNPL